MLRGLLRIEIAFAVVYVIAPVARTETTASYANGITESPPEIERQSLRFFRASGMAKEAGKCCV